MDKDELEELADLARDAVSYVGQLEDAIDELTGAAVFAGEDIEDVVGEAEAAVDEAGRAIGKAHAAIAKALREHETESSEDKDAA
jgi:hypothetical protein